MILSSLLFIGLLSVVLAQDNYPNKVAIDQSLGYGFTAEYFDNYKVITNLITNKKYALLCCNQAISNFSSAGYHAVVSTPLASVGIDSELDTLTFFELLNLESNVLSAKPSANITSTCFNGVSDSPTNLTATVDAIFIGDGNNADLTVKPQYISMSASSNTLTPLQQSAWIIYIAHFFDLENNALEVYNEIKSLYSCHKSNLANSGSKNIAWTTYDAMSKAWSVRYDAYLASLVQDSGMKLTSQNNQTTTYTSLNEFHTVLEHVDFVIDDTPAANFKAEFSYGDWLSAAGFDANSNAFPFLADLNVYRTDKLINSNGYSDWPIRHVARADLAISDVIHMVYNTYEPSYNMTWLRAFAQMGDSVFVSNATYPSCTNIADRLSINTCPLGAFTPNVTVDTTAHRSSNPDVSSGLTTGGKVGIAVGVIVAVGGVAVLGTFGYRKYKFRNRPAEGNFYRMNDI